MTTTPNTTPWLFWYCVIASPLSWVLARLPIRTGGVLDPDLLSCYVWLLAAAVAMVRPIGWKRRWILVALALPACYPLWWLVFMLLAVMWAGFAP